MYAGQKARRRLRKAAPTNAPMPVDPTPAVADDDLADDVMVELDDVVPSEEATRGLQAEAEYKGVAGRGSTGRGAEGRGAARQPAGMSNRRDKSDAEEGGAMPAGKPRKRLKKAVSSLTWLDVVSNA